jgi:cold shock CspA family protein
MIQTGVVAHWSESGYGFIRPDDPGENVFIHRSNLRDTSYLREGDRVEFEARLAERGMRADYARLVS